jgi:hypothetical protein
MKGNKKYIKECEKEAKAKNKEEINKTKIEEKETIEKCKDKPVKQRKECKEEAKDYYVNCYFNFGNTCIHTNDNMVKCISIRQL